MILIHFQCNGREFFLNRKQPSNLSGRFLFVNFFKIRVHLGGPYYKIQTAQRTYQNSPLFYLRPVSVVK